MTTDIPVKDDITEVDYDLIMKLDITEHKKIYMINRAYMPHTLHTMPDDDMTRAAVLRLYINNFIPELYLITSYGYTYKFLNNDYRTYQLGEWVGIYSWESRTFEVCDEPEYLDEINNQSNDESESDSDDSESEYDTDDDRREYDTEDTEDEDPCN